MSFYLNPINAIITAVIISGLCRGTFQPYIHITNIKTDIDTGVDTDIDADIDTCVVLI
jgi:hypothetical protein